jgi:molybdate transport system regulatory protein
MPKPTIRFRLDFSNGCAVGPGKIDLLEHIRDSGSLSQAGRDLEMSYRRAWLLLDSLNTSFREHVVATNVGGKAGGGASLTEFGAALIDAYRELEAEFNAIAAKKLAAIASIVGPKRKAPAITRTPLVRSQAPRRVKKKGRGRASRRP